MATEIRTAAERWPDLFAELDENQRRAIVQTLASARLEGWVPDREMVELLVSEARGLINEAEYMRRALALAERHRKVPATG